MNIRSSLLLFCSFFVFLSRALAEPSALEHLAAFLQGSFSNADQARGDQNFRPTTLHLAPIWADRTDGPWFYLEQALADAPRHPYRQSVYQLAALPDNAVELRLFELANPIAVTGAWNDTSRFSAFSPANLISRPGCALVLRLQPGGLFKGGTAGKGCASDLRGAAYSTTEMTVDFQRIATWERGYNSAGVQVWGSIHGGYLFKKIE